MLKMSQKHLHLEIKWIYKCQVKISKGEKQQEKELWSDAQTNKVT